MKTLLFLSLLLLSSFAFAYNENSSEKNSSLVFVFGKCLGHITICDDNFNEKIIIKKKFDGTIITNLTFNHPHIIEVSEGKVEIRNNIFNSTHIIKNNLNNKFLMILEGDLNRLSKVNLSIVLGEEKLATINLKKIN